MGFRITVNLGLLLILAAGFTWAWRGWTAYSRERAEFVEPPEAGRERPPAGHGRDLVRDVTWTLRDGTTQQAWFLPSRNGALMIFVHGSPGSRLSLWAQASALSEDGYGALLLDLPGYGHSEGARHWDQAFEESVAKAVDFAAQAPSVDPDRIAGFGFSLGSCLVAKVAADDPRIRSLVLLAPFTNLRDQLLYQFRSRWPGVPQLAVLAARQAGVPVAQLDTAHALRRIGNRPVLLIGGLRDPVIPPAMVEKLAASSQSSSLWLEPDMGHGWMETDQPFPMERIRTFLRRTLQPGTGSGAFSVP